MEVKFRVVKSGMSFDEIKKNIDFQFISISKGMVVLGEDIKTHMQTVIGTSKTRQGSKGNLEKSIKVYREASKGKAFVGIGKISEMNTIAPYWYVINFGGFSGVTKAGKVVPGSFGGSPPNSSLKGTGLGTEAYNYSRGGPFFMKPTSPIMAMNYIERTIMYVNTIIKVHFSNWTGKTKVFSK